MRRAFDFVSVYAQDMSAEQQTAWRGDVSMQTSLDVLDYWVIGVPTAGTQSLQPPGATVGQLAHHMIVIDFAEPLNTSWEIRGYSFRVNGDLKGELRSERSSRSGGFDGKAETISL